MSALHQHAWVEWWRDLQPRLPGTWVSPWLQTSDDGNPIFTAWCPERRIGIRVIEHEFKFEPFYGEFELDYYKDYFDKDGPNEVREFVITIGFTDRGAVEALTSARLGVMSWLEEYAW